MSVSRGALLRPYVLALRRTSKHIVIAYHSLTQPGARNYLAPDVTSKSRTHDRNLPGLDINKMQTQISADLEVQKKADSAEVKCRRVAQPRKPSEALSRREHRHVWRCRETSFCLVTSFFFAHGEGKARMLLLLYPVQATILNGWSH